MTSARRDTGLDVLNLFFPRRCFFCGTALERGTCICRECLSTVLPIEVKSCRRCGAPLTTEVSIGDDLSVKNGMPNAGGEADASGGGERAAGCPQCDDLRLLFGRNESYGVYEGTLRELIHLYKFGKRRSLHNLFAELLVASKRRFILGHDLIAPVPLTRERALERGYNQSFLVARGIAERLPVAFYGEVLLRKGKGKPQSGVRTRRERLANITDRIRVVRGAVRRVRRSSVLLFDDVFTTGATASECAKALVREGARSVDLLTIARALMEPGDV
jgi:ComF family protein